MTIAEKFWEWQRMGRIRWKSEDHASIVHQFDTGAKVTYFNKRPDSHEHYDEQTLVTFSDGSSTDFNYKGE